MKKNPLYLLVGKSGAGKDTIADRLHEVLGFHKVKSYTTRPQRNPNKDVYYYVTEDEFAQLDIVQHAVFSGNHYGATREELDRSQVFACCPDGMPDVVARYTERPLIAIYLDASDEARAERMRARGDTEAALCNRLAHDACHFGAIPPEIPCVTVNANQPIDKVLHDVVNIIKQHG